MAVFQNLTFSLTELVALLGLAQALMILVHVIFRMTSFRGAAPYLAYFLTLALGFTFHLTYRIDVFYYQIDYLSWFVWSMATPISVLLIVSILKGGRPIHPLRYMVLTVIPLAALIAGIWAQLNQTCLSGYLCEDAFGIYFSAGVIAQCLCFAFFFGVDLSMEEFRKQDHASERYWLIVCLVVVNLLLIGLGLWALNHDISLETLSLARGVLGLVFVYIISTLMFRIYPGVLPLQTDPKKMRGESPLSAEEQDLKTKIADLMAFDKLYQEAGFSRSDLARELETSEAAVSQVINRAFHMNFSTFINSYRVEEAKGLLQKSDYAVVDIAKMTGFNSIASFNRVFKDTVGITPTGYRRKQA